MASSTPRRANPLGFTPWPVTIITTLVYLAIVIPLLVIHLVVPSAPRTSPKGLDLDQAWLDLEHLSGGFHPYNTHRNDEVHGWLLQRIGEIVKLNAADDQKEGEEEGFVAVKEGPEVFVFDDVQSNLTFAGQSISGPSTSVYFEGTNIIVYIRGLDDDQKNWWETPGRDPAKRGGVLVNSHYDSVSTGYGATDDGVGVITCLQLIQYFTTPGHAPHRGLVVLFNNGEEDFLNGAWAFSQHPMSRFTHTFLNLEGAGAGGRAMLFRSSDTEVTGFYKRAKHPFGTVLSSDGFNSGLLRSQTDYVVFDYELGMRGLDVAFIEPRARYHTDQDDAKHTSRNSLWHMLSAAVSTTEGLVSDTSSQFDGEPRDKGKVPSGTGSKAVWFDLFGCTFAVFQLHTLFALSVTLLIVAPLTLLATSITLGRADKMYLFRSSAKVEDSDESVQLQALRGLFRFPFLLAIPTAVAAGLAYLVTKVNPYIAHSSQYAVWTMMVSAWLFTAWFVARVADFARPSAFHRAYSLTWMFVVTWVLLVIVTTWEHQLGLAGGYFIFFVFAGVFLATWTAYLELFSLPRKSEYVAAAQLANGSRRPSSYGSRLGETSGEDAGNGEQEEPTESTSLLRNGQRTTFANYVRVTGESGGREDTEGTHDTNIYPYEQPWSAKMPQWMWILQFLLTAPIVLILVGPLALMLTSTLHQTGQDGSSVLFLYLSMAAFTTLLLFSVLPYIHRFTYHIPMFFLLVLAGTLIYNLVAFPFSETSRLKLFFQQEVDLDTGINRVSLTGIRPFVEDVTRSLPSAAGQDVACDWVADRIKCKWNGPLPHVLEDTAPHNTPPTEWMSFDVSKPAKKSKAQARFSISGQNTRACKLVFETPIFNYTVAGSAYDPRFPHLRPEGSKEIRLWSREWGHEWTVDVEWAEASGPLKGRAVCLWSDANTEGVIPALDEVKRYSPAWIGISKLSDGLVEASRGFEIDE